MTDIKQPLKSWTLPSPIYRQVISLIRWHDQSASDCWKSMTRLVEITTEVGCLLIFICNISMPDDALHTCNTRGQLESAHLFHPWDATNGIGIQQDQLYMPHGMSVYLCEIMQLSHALRRCFICERIDCSPL